MHFLKYIELQNFLNIKSARLNGLRDLNIIIGPNNCGKTSLLKAVNLLSRTDFARVAPAFSSCEICKKLFDTVKDFQNARCSISVREKYLAKRKVRVVFGYCTSEIERIIPELSERQSNLLASSPQETKFKDHLGKEFAKERLVMKEQEGGFSAEHLSPIIWNKAKAEIFDNMIFCPDERLQIYKDKRIPEYISSRDLTASEQSQIIGFMREVVDPKLIDIHHSLKLVRDVANQPFTTAIEEQGSGVKSLFCLMSDILFKRQTRLLLIDEPELGLNPTGKHAFLKFLIEQSKGKQVFLATHDPTFVNPILWNRENVSVYLFSIIDGAFRQINLVQSIQDPNTFAGFLPHTTSLKQVHIYVEGTTDVYNFQIFLDKYAKRKFEENWIRILNKIGIFHLGGDFWSHLLYTIPREPYISTVVLDGDKKEMVGEVILKYSTVEEERFKFFASLDKLSDMYETLRQVHPSLCPVYCLKSPEMEDYLKPRPSSKKEGPLVAYQMKHIPKEIELLFDTLFKMAEIRNE